MDKLAGRKTLRVASILDEFEKDRIKARIDIVSLFASFGVSLERKGKSYLGRCPWHEDGTPSLSVDREKGLYNCFGCGEAGDAFTLVEKMKGVDFKGALEYLKNGNLPAVHTEPPVPHKPPLVHAPDLREPSYPLDTLLPKDTPDPKDTKDTAYVKDPLAPSDPLELRDPVAPHPSPIDTRKLLADVAERYRANLLSFPEARAYLARRGLDTPEVINTFRLGYATGELSRTLSDEQKRELTRAGIFTAAGREHFSGCIVVPLLDTAGQVVSFYGRRIHDGKPAKLPTHLYPAGAHRGLVNSLAAKVYPDSLILTESVLDALSLVALDIKNVVPCYGVKGFTKDHEKLLKDERVTEVLIAFDADEAGRAGAASLGERLGALGIAVKTIESPSGKDWNDFLVSGGTREEFEAIIAKAAAAQTVPKGDILRMTKETGRYLFSRGDGSVPSVRYRLSGVRESFSASLRVSLRTEVSPPDDGAIRVYVDTADLYSARSRASYAQAASSLGLEIPLVERDLLAMLDRLEAERDERFSSSEAGPHIVSEEERSLGLELLTSPDLIARIEADLGTVGYVGEGVNKLLLYLAATSRKLSDPISVIVSSQSASGKSYLIDTVKALMPEEDVVSMTSLSDQALNYLDEEGLLHKFLVMGEAVHSLSVEHQLREMLSAKELSRLVAVKDEKTGRLSSKLVRKKVLVSLAMSTTNSEVNPENASRCFVVSTDESEGQTREVHRVQRAKYSLERLALRDEAVPRIIACHQAAQRILERVAIVNPYGQLLDFPARMMRTRRDHERFLDLIAAVAFLRQYQKPRVRDGAGREYIQCDLEDYRIAYRVMTAILPQTLSAFPRSASDLYAAFRALAKTKAEAENLYPAEVVIGQRELRETTGFSQMFVKRNLRTLCDYEYLIESGGFQRGARRGYRLLEDKDLSLVDLSSIPTPAELEEAIKAHGMELQNV